MMLRFLFLAIIVLVLSACAAQDVIIRVNNDGSGTVEVRAGINKAYDAAKREPEDDPNNSPNVESIRIRFDAIKAELPNEWQADVSPWDDGTYQGAKLVLRFANNTMLQEQLNYLLDQAQSEPYSDTFVSVAAKQDQGRAEIQASLVGVVLRDDNGEPLPSGPEGAGRLTWTVVLPQMDTCQPGRFATCANNQASWNLPVNQLQLDETLELVAAGQLNANAPALPTAVPATAVPAAATTVPPTNAPTGTGATSVPPTAAPTQVGATPTQTLLPTTAPTAPTALPSATRPPEGTIGPVVASPAAGEARTPTAVAATLVPPDVRQPTAAGISTSVTAESAETVVAIAPTVSNPIELATPAAQTYAPIVADASAPGEQAQPVAAPPTRPRSRRPALPYRNVAIVVCLLAAAACLGYVGTRRLRLRRAAEAAATPREDGL